MKAWMSEQSTHDEGISTAPVMPDTEKKKAVNQIYKDKEYLSCCWKRGHKCAHNAAAAAAATAAAADAPALAPAPTP